jgi:hypothetical protein
MEKFFVPPKRLIEGYTIADDGAEYPEHVSVLFKGAPADMFVDETGVLKGLPRNEAATAIYRANWLKQHPEQDPEALPHIAGTAVVTGRRIWF